MIDDFLHRLRAEPPPAFLADLKTKLDRQAPPSPPRWSGFRLAIALLVGGSAVALVSIVNRGRLRDAPQSVAATRPEPTRIDERPLISSEPRTRLPAAPDPGTSVLRSTVGADSSVDASSSATTPFSSNGSITIAGPALLLDDVREVPTRLQSKGAKPSEFAAVDTTKALAELCHIAVPRSEAAATVTPAVPPSSARYPDLVVADRRMLKAELESCTRNGVNRVVEFNVGEDVIVLVRSKLYGAPSMSLLDLYLALAAQIPDPVHPGTLIPNPHSSWTQVDPTLVEEKIDVSGPALTSPAGKLLIEVFLEAGCSSYAWLAALRESDAPRYDAACRRVRTDGAYHELDAHSPQQHLADYLDANPNALALLGAVSLERAWNFTAAAIDGVAPTVATMQSGAYPGARGRFVYLNAARPPNQKLGEFLVFVLQSMADKDSPVFLAPDDAQRRKNLTDAFRLPELKL